MAHALLSWRAMANARSMAPGRLAASIPDPAHEILAYLESHPTAADSLDGIVNWWLPRQRFAEARERIQASLDELIQRGLVDRVRLADGTVLYSKAAPRAEP